MALRPLERQIVLEASQQEFESQAVLNPAVYYENGLVHMFYRAVQPGNYSSIGYAVFRDNHLLYRAPVPILKPETAVERHGLEDPRITKLGNTFYLVFTAYDGADIQMEYATATSLPNFVKQGSISPPFTYDELDDLCKDSPDSYFCKYSTHDNPNPAAKFLWDKDAFIFPEHIHGKLVLVHRLHPEIQLLYFNSFRQLTRAYWQRYLDDLKEHTLLARKFDFENSYIGGGVPPIRTDAGWLFIYHAVEQTSKGSIYRAAVALLDLEQPRKVLGRLPYPLFEPHEAWEKVGDVNNVVFPTGAVILGDALDIYYGAADKRIGRIRFSLSELLKELLAS